MFKTFFSMYRVSYTLDANAVHKFLNKLPLLRNHVSNTVSGIIALILRIICELVLKIGFVGVFMFLPHILFSRYMETGLLGFGLENCFVYFAVIISGLCGSVVKSEVFHNNEYSYLMLKIYRVNPLNFFRYKILRKSITDLVGFCLVFSLFGMNIFKAFYLALVIVLARFVGEAFNIYIFRITGKSLLDLRGVAVFLMLGGLIMAYFVPYIRGFVPAAYNLVFSTTWLLVILIAGSLFIYYIWNYKSYNKIAMRIYTLADLMDMNGEEGFGIKEKYKDVVTGLDWEEYPDEERKDYLPSEKFFIRNRKLLITGIVARVFAIFAVIVGMIVVVVMKKADVVSKVISYSLPVLFFIMFIMARGKSLCRELYYSGDRILMSEGYYDNKENVFKNYFAVLKDVIFVDMIPALMLVFGYALAAFMVGEEAKFDTTMSVCLGIIFLSVLFSNYHVFMYYMCMPFAPEEGRIGKSVGAIIYLICNILVYAGCYLCIFVEARALHFVLVIALLCAVFMSLTATIVWNFGVKTFKNKQK